MVFEIIKTVARTRNMPINSAPSSRKRRKDEKFSTQSRLYCTSSAQSLSFSPSAIEPPFAGSPYASASFISREAGKVAESTPSRTDSCPFMPALSSSNASFFDM